MAIVAVFIVVGVAVVMLAGGSLMGDKLSASDIAAVAAQAGFSGPDLQVAVAVALAESSGNPTAVGDVNVPVAGAQSTGLWQINSHFHPEFTGQDLTDPQTNANAAYSVYHAAGDSFSPWSTYKSGAYSSNIVIAQQGVQDAGLANG